MILPSARIFQKQIILILMASSTEKLEQIIKKITDEINRASRYFYTERVINDKFSEGEISTSRTFFETALFAFRRVTILAISRLVENDAESITFNYLFDHIENHPRIFKHADKKGVKKLLTAQRIHFNKYSDLFESVRSLRDRELAHFDRKHINDPSAIIPKPIELLEIEQSLKVLLEIVNEITVAYNGTTLSFEWIEEFIRKDIEALFDAIN